MKLSMLLIPVLFLAISVDALATPSPSPAHWSINGTVNGPFTNHLPLT